MKPSKGPHFTYALVFIASDLTIAYSFPDPISSGTGDFSDFRAGAPAIASPITSYPSVFQASLSPHSSLCSVDTFSKRLISAILSN